MNEIEKSRLKFMKQFDRDILKEQLWEKYLDKRNYQSIGNINYIDSTLNKVGIEYKMEDIVEFIDNKIKLTFYKSINTPSRRIQKVMDTGHDD